MVLTILLAELNDLRQQLGLPVLTPEHMRQSLRDFLHTHPRGGP